MLRRQFLVIKDFATDTAAALANKDHLWLKRLVLRDKDVNKLADFCRRLINKQQMNAGTYTIVEQLEKISDRYKDICRYASQKQLTASKSVLQAVNKVNAYLDEFYRCFYQFSLQAVEKFYSQRKEIISMLDKLHERCSREEQRVLFWLEDIVEKTFDLNGPLMVSRL